MPRRVAVIFYGLTRTLSKTIDSLHENLFKVLLDNSFEYDIFIHHYKINGPYHNEWSKEHTQTYTNEDVESILQPKYCICDTQDDIIDNINFNAYYKKLGNWTGMNSTLTKYLIKNMCLALYSKKQITEIFRSYANNYDYAIIIRPDLLLKNKIDIKWFDELNNSNIIIPSCDSFSGCNDRMCIGKIEIILYYGTLFDNLQAYSEEKSIISERYLLDMLNKKEINILTKNILYETIRII